MHSPALLVETILSNIDDTIEGFISSKIDELKNDHFPDSDVIVYYGGITEWAKQIYHPVLEDIGRVAKKRETSSLVIILSVTGTYGKELKHLLRWLTKLRGPKTSLWHSVITAAGILMVGLLV